MWYVYIYIYYFGCLGEKNYSITIKNVQIFFYFIFKVKIFNYIRFPNNNQN